MGLLNTDGPPMVWGSDRNNKSLKYVRDHGIAVLLKLYARYSSINNSPFLWGDEIEHILVQEDPKTGHLKLSLRAAPVLDRLTKEGDPAFSERCGWRPEYGSFMIESVPAEPFGADAKSFATVEANMRERTQMIDAACAPGERGIMVVSYPMLGVGDFHNGDVNNRDVTYSQSLFIPDICINQTHPRFGNLTRNIRLRRGRKVCIQIPMYIDRFTLKSTVDPVYNIDAHPQNKAINCGGNTYGEKRTRPVAFDDSDDDDDDEDETDEAIAKKKAAGRGNGTAEPPSSSSGAVTHANRDFSTEETDFFRHIYTPSSDYYYAQYQNTADTTAHVKERYDACPCPVPSVSHPCVYMDCMAFGMGLSCLQVTMQLKNINEARHIYDQVVPLCPLLLALTSATPFQKGVLCDSDVRWVTISASVDDRKPEEVPRILKSRYDSVSMYISPETKNLEEFNGPLKHVDYDQAYYDQLTKAGMDDRLARHFAHLFIRDPLVIFEEGVEQIDDNERSDHFENIQSTNWQTVRFKPPPYNSDIGWRVEFRVMEVAPTAFENAAFSIFTILFVQATLKKGTTSYIPMSSVDENMGTAHKRNPAQEKYFFNLNMNTSAAELSLKNLNEKKLSLDEIFNGCTVDGFKFEGLIAFVRGFAKEAGLHTDEVRRYLDFIALRAKGDLKTPAQLFREFVTTHPDYKQDSRLTETIAKDYASFVAHLTETQVWPGYLTPELTKGTAKEFKLGQKWTK